jgi:site-specific recombinase XerC
LHFLCARPTTFADPDVDVGTIPSVVSAIVELLACGTEVAGRFCLSVNQRAGQEAALRFQFCRRLLATGCQKSRSTHRGRRKVRTLQLRHSLSNWLVNKAKVEPKTVQGILRHAKIQTTLDLYTQEDSDQTRAAQGQFLTAVGMNATGQ